MPNITVIPAWFGPGQSLSDKVNLTGTIVGLVMPTENWSSATVTVQGSPDGVNFYDLHDGVAGAELAFNARLGSLVMLNPNRMRSCRSVILRSGTRAAPVVQPQAVGFGIVIETDDPVVAPLPT